MFSFLIETDIKKVIISRVDRSKKETICVYIMCYNKFKNYDIWRNHNATIRYACGVTFTPADLPQLSFSGCPDEMVLSL